MDVTNEYQENATPGSGCVEYDDGFVKSDYPEEVRIAGWIHRTFGGNVRLLKRSTGYKVRTADYLWDGKLWELKSTTTAKSANSAVRHGLTQIEDDPGGIILDYGGHLFSTDELLDVLAKRMRSSARAPVDIMIIQAGKLFKVFRYKK